MGQRHGKPTPNSRQKMRLILICDFQPFEQITSLTDVAEGSIVRVITRLDETCREVRDAARVIGDAELFKKMEECQIKIKRDSECYRIVQTCFTLIVCSHAVVFAASLYF